MKINICENTLEKLHVIVDILNKIISLRNFDFEISISTLNPNDIIENMSDSSETGVYILNTNYNFNLNGFILAQKIREFDPRGFIIFITNHLEMSYVTFLYKLEALDFILETSQQEVTKRLDECLTIIQERTLNKKNKPHAFFPIKIYNQTYHIKFNDILYFETSSLPHKILLHTKDKNISFNSSLNTIQKNLNSYFCRCHRSFIINKNYIKEINFKNHYIKMLNNDLCPLSKRLSKNLNDV